MKGSDDPSFFPPIGNYALIGDMQACALVSRSGSVDWLCLPNIADPPLFSGVLGRWGGRFRIWAEGDWTVEQEYLDDTPILRTRFIQEAASFCVTDFLALRTEGLGGPIEPERELLRIVEVETGSPKVAFSFEPRPGFGRDPRLQRRQTVSTKPRNRRASETPNEPPCSTSERAAKITEP